MCPASLASSALHPFHCWRTFTDSRALESYQNNFLALPLSFVPLHARPETDDATGKSQQIMPMANAAGSKFFAGGNSNSNRITLLSNFSSAPNTENSRMATDEDYVIPLWGGGSSPPSSSENNPAAARNGGHGGGHGGHYNGGRCGFESNAVIDRAMDVALESDRNGNHASAAAIMALQHELSQAKAEIRRMKTTGGGGGQGGGLPSMSAPTQKFGGEQPPPPKSKRRGLGALLGLRGEIDASNRLRLDPHPVSPPQQPRQQQVLPGRRAESESIPPEPVRAIPVQPHHHAAARNRRGSGMHVGQGLADMMNASVIGRRFSAVSHASTLSGALTELQAPGTPLHDEHSISTPVTNDKEGGGAGATEGEAAEREAKAKKKSTFVPLVARHACTAFIGTSNSSHDEEQESSRSEEQRLLLMGAFAERIRSTMNEAYRLKATPDRSDTSKFAVLPSGTGVALCILEAAPDHPNVERTAMWIASRLLVWASEHGDDSSDRGDDAFSLRCGLAGGMLETVRDIYDLPNVSGPSVDLAARIMDCALPGQILVSSESVANILETASSEGPQQDAPDTGLSYHVDKHRHEVIVDHDRTALVQAVTGAVTLVSSENSNGSSEDAAASSGVADAGAGEAATPSSSIHPFGTNSVPEKKWYLRLKPTELAHDERTGRAKGKVPPTELLKRHRRVAFVGVTHDRLSTVFRKVLDADPDHTWDRIYLLFLSDARLEWVADEMHETVDGLVESKLNARWELEQVLKGKVRELKFLEYDRPFYCASYWDWDERGGFVHVSPLVWGANPKVCPAMNYHWIGEDPGNDYVSYQDGLTSLLRTAKAIGADGKAEENSGDNGGCVSNPSVLAMLAKLEKQQNARR